MTQRAIDGPYIYFVTTNTTYRKHFFNTAERAESFVAIVREACAKYGFDLFGYAILPDHVHLLVRKSGHETLSKLMKHIKGRFWRVVSGGRFWQPRFNFRIIENDERFLNTVEYFRYNYSRHSLDEKFGQPPYVFVDWKLVGRMF